MGSEMCIRDRLYTKLAGLNNFDMLFELKKLLGHRLKLESIARPTLGTGKSADGMQALKWYKEGKLDKIIEYCKVDVEVTRDIHRFALEHGKLLYDSKLGIKTVNVEWKNCKEKKAPQQMSYHTLAAWSTGMIFAQGVRGPGFNSQSY